MKLARAIHFDESDMNVFHSPARTGEWCISGGFEFSNWGEADLTGKARQAFANGWLGLETYGRVTFVAVTQVEAAERDALEESAGELVKIVTGLEARTKALLQRAGGVSVYRLVEGDRVERVRVETGSTVGDRVEIRIQGIGSLVNEVAPWE